MSKIHKYRPFTTRDGSEACAECYGHRNTAEHRLGETKISDLDREEIQRPDLCAVACMKRIQDFMRDEIRRAKNRDDYPYMIQGKIALANDVDELVRDILRVREMPGVQ